MSGPHSAKKEKLVEFFAGIDGGGTRTSVLVESSDRSVSDKKVFPAFNFNSIGEAAFRSLVTEILSWLETFGPCQKLCIGAAGISNARMSDCLNDMLSSSSVVKSYEVTGDQVIAHYGALSGKEGIILIAGTGSVCYGRDEGGKEARSSGWGHLIGDDGSGYALGRDALRHLAKVYDGYGQATILKTLASERLGLDSRERIIGYVYSGTKKDVADLSPLVEQAALAGDDVACTIVSANVSALADYVGAVSSHLDIENADCATLGGLIDHDTLIRRSLVQELARRGSHVTLVYPQHDAAHGALMMARSGR